MSTCDSRRQDKYTAQLRAARERNMREFPAFTGEDDAPVSGRPAVVRAAAVASPPKPAQPA